MNERTFQWNSKKFDFNENVFKKLKISLTVTDGHD
jgi:hypothetical protein